MRLDKFLKNARIIKRRPVAKEACEKGRVLVNDKEAKPGTELEIGDEVEVRFGNRTFKVKVQGLEEHVKKEEAENLYEVIE
ncbi:RNA-binding S4 domain-containing protein [Isachenkonia alkalipeptolytica]|uniref:RQC P-site tRNA stabilizing factor n=1 Tax=Isachenkonia alkalipeptolytica TaxID=2565777 RepID=A0AA44BEE6_9CLOT|nr:RNA-binding S4 domain-containing protein [Isachenkonia alkalipeptolytica]NBG88902.1 RNA-binding S4 domain-containing protein [Isachenkonia alkalipeptolytica]